MVLGNKSLEERVAEQLQEQIQEQLQIQEEKHLHEKRELDAEQRERQRIEHLAKEAAGKENRPKQLHESQRIEQEKQRIERLKLASPEALGGLRDLVRTRYQLDVEIWGLKESRGPDRALIIEKMEKSDAILMEIYAMVETWEENATTWSAEEWKLAQQIKERILSDGKRWWENNPPRVERFNSVEGLKGTVRTLLQQDDVLLN